MSLAMASSYFVDKWVVGFRYFVDHHGHQYSGWRPTEAWAERAARRRLRTAGRVAHP
jgi:hypothetical protein